MIKNKIFNLLVLAVILVIVINVKGNEISEITIQIPSFYNPAGEKEKKEKVDSKLDFNSSDEDSSTSGTTTRHSSKGNSSPKIQGVRVTVDTGKSRKSAESGSKESVEIVESKKGKRVGIHTDITFEITDDNDSNSTDSRDRDDTDASVPVYRGRGSSTTNRPRKPYDPKQHHWGNQPPQRHHGGGSGNDYYPNYPRVNDQEYYRDHNQQEGWSGFIPATSVWTTERSYQSGFKNYDAPRWKPCYCVSSDGRNRRDSRIGYLKVDDKLDKPFSSSNKN